jgi:transcription elongation factor GreA
MKTFLTQEGLEKLKKELYELENVKRKEVTERIRHTAAQGDLKENAAYHMAKDEQGFMEARVREIRDIISQVEIIKSHGTETVQIGSKVFLESENGKDVYQIVGPEEADIMDNKISFKSPLGESLINRKKNDTVSIMTPDGEKKYKISNIE